MGDVKERLHVRVNAQIIDKIDSVAEENHLSKGGAISLMVDDYYARKAEEHIVIKSIISELLDAKLSPMTEKLNRLQVTGNVIDRDTKIALEFMNHYYLVNDFAGLVTTEEHKTKGMKHAEALIQKRIQKQRKKKLDYEREQAWKHQNSITSGENT